MNVTRDWLWDRKITLEKARQILKDPADRHFLSLSAALLSRKNIPREVFRYYLKPIDFLQNWLKIKRQMRRDKWNNPRIEYWQAVYEVLKKKFEKKGIYPAREVPPVSKKEDEFYQAVSDKIKLTRKQKGLTQNALARKLGVSQQMISRIEKGRENISLATLRNITEALGSEIRIEII
jgi:DNA-binding XRE family transcriptional regulator